MPEFVTINRGASDCIIWLLRSLLEEGKIGAVFAPARINDKGLGYSLIADPQLLDHTVPFHPWMPQNGGKQLSRLTLIGPSPKPVAAVLRPCELRAFVELIKREQGGRENLILISSTCGGVYPIDTLADDEVDDRLSAYWKALGSAEILPDGRDACRSCQHLVPYSADLTVSLVGNTDNDQRCTIFIGSEAGREVIEGVEGNRGTAEIETAGLEKLKAEREAVRDKLFDELKLEGLGLDGLVGMFGKCISCHNCRAVCPICYCKLCDFDSAKYEREFDSYGAELNNRAGVRVPPDTLLFQLGRMTHMGVSCVGCGMCSDVCPVDIPVSSLFAKIGQAIQGLFDYVPGKDEAEELPIVQFEMEELEELAV